MRKIVFVLFFFVSLIKADDICISQPIVVLSPPSLIPPTPPKYTKGITIKANSNIKDINITIAERDLQPFFENYIPSFFQLDKIKIDGNPKSKENDNPDHYCTGIWPFKKCTDDPNLRASVVDNLKLNDIFPFPGVPGFSSIVDGSLYNIDQMNKNETHDLTKEMSGPEALANLFSDYAPFLRNFFNTSVVLASYEKDGKLYKNMIVNPCGDVVPEVSVNDASMGVPETDKNMTFIVNINGKISGDIANATHNKSYIHYHTEDGTAHQGEDYISVEGTIVINKGQTTAEINVTIKANAKPGKFYLILDNAYGARIVDGNATGTIINNQNNIYTTGPFDAWDTDHNISDRNITTKIVGKEFNLTIASINKDNNATEKKPGIVVKYALVSNEGNLSGWRDFNATNNETITASYTINKADKNVSVMFKVCANYIEKKYILKPYNNCHNECNPNDKANEVCLRKFKSSDDFAIRPAKYKVLEPNQKLIAGKDINITVQALDYNGNLINDFNFTSAPVELNITDALGCKTGILNKPSSLQTTLNFINGEANLTLNYSEVGDLNISVKEYKNGFEYARTDENDSIDSSGNVETNEILLIGEGNSTLSRFYPDHFEINATYNNFNNGSFTYVSSDLNMSALLDINITAENEDNGTTHNYNKNCYSEDFNLSFSYEIKPSDFNVTKNIPKLKYILNSIADTREGNITTNNYYLNFPNLTKNLFNTDDNGSAHISVKINFDKNYSNSFEEFNMTIRDVNVSDVNGTFGTRDINDSARFIYGRIKVSNAAAYSNDINTTFEYQYWTDEGWVVNKDHNDTNDTNDGNVTITSPLYAPNPSDVTVDIIRQSSKDILEGKEKIKISTTHSLPYSAKIHLKINSWLWYHPLAKDYKAPDSNNTDCLTHPCMKVDFLTSGEGWGGVQSINNAKFSEGNRTSEINASHTDVNVSKSQVKKINW